MVEPPRACPLCDAVVASDAELCAHLDHDHLGALQPGRFTTYRPPTATKRGMVTVPLDTGRPLGSRTLDTAVAIARQARFELELVSVVEPAHRRVAAAFLRAAARRVEAAGVAGERWAVLGDGAVAERLLEHLADQLPDLVCAATNPVADVAAGADLFGTITGQLVRRSPVPLVVLGPAVSEPPVVIARIVACLDGSPQSEQALAVAAALARRMRCELHLVRVLGPRGGSGRAYLRRMAGRAGAPCAGYESLHGSDVAAAILDHVDASSTADRASARAAPGVTLLAMGALGLTAAGHDSTTAATTSVGSITEAVVLEARVPVLVVPAAVAPAQARRWRTGSGAAVVPSIGAEPPTVAGRAIPRA